MKQINVFYSKLILIICVLGLLSPLSFTEEKKEQQTSTQSSIVHEVVVEGEAVEKTATVTMITAEEIKKRNLATVAEALENVPGSHIRVGGKGEAYVRLRGFRQRELAVLIDGIPVSSPYDGQLDLSSIPVDAVQRIDVVKGASSVMYGANAMGGVINIITKKAALTSTEQDSSNHHMSLKGNYGSGESSRIGSTFMGNMGKFRYFVTGSYFNQEYYPLSDNYEPAMNQDEGDRENSDRQGWSGRVGLDWDMGETGKMGVNFTHIDLERGLPHHESDTRNKYWRFTDWTEGVIDVFYRNNFGKLTMDSRFFYQYFNNSLRSYDDRTYSTQDSKSAWTSSYDDDAMGGDLHFRLPSGEKLLWKAALRFKHDTHRQQGDIGDEWEEYNIDMFSLPLEGEWKPVNGLTLIYGASLDMMLFNHPQENKNKNTTAINPQIALLYSLNNQWNLKAATSIKTRFPTMKELFSFTSGNPDLEPMRSTGFELGLEYRPVQHVSLSLVGFYNDIKDMINRAGKYDPYINIDKAVFKGIEAGMTWDIGTTARLDLAYTYLKAEDKSESGQNYIEHRPEHKLDAALSLQLPGKFTVQLNTGFVSKQFYYEDDEKMWLDSYTLMDIRVGKRIMDRFELFIAARNLFDVNYYESEGFPREGRMIYGGINIDVF